MSRQVLLPFAILVTSLALVVLQLGCSDVSRRNSSSQREVIGLRVTAGTWHDLVLELQNLGPQSVELRADSLPWQYRYNILIKAFKDDAVGSPLDERLTIADSLTSSEKIVLLPGECLRGRIDLRKRFPDLEGVLHRHNVIVFWSYTPELTNGDRGTRLSGSLTLSRLGGNQSYRTN